MPFTAYLIVRQHGQIAAELLKCPSLAGSAAAAPEVNGWLRIEVFHALVVEDLYGDVNPVSADEAKCWEKGKSIPILLEADLGSPDCEGYIGKWNIQLLQWLKAISIAADEMVAIEYEHERGDYLYEVAWWSSDPASAEGQVEAFGIQRHDGMVNPEWRREAIRHADGRIELKVNEWASGCLPDD
jgi:hypothetical protein